MFYITNHQGNTNQNHNEISSHTCTNGYHQEKRKCWQGYGEKGTLMLSLGMQIGIATMDNSMEVPKKIKNITTM